MAFYIIGANGRKSRESYDLHQLQEMADEGTIKPTSLLESEGGHQGQAGQVPGLRFNTATPPPIEQTARDVGWHAQQGTGSAFAWLFDFSFNDIRIHTVALWFCRIGYVLLWIGAVLGGLWWTYLIFRASEVFGPLILIAVPFVWLGVVINMFVVRLYFEGFLIVFDWIVETTKAARIYIENNRRN